MAKLLRAAWRRIITRYNVEKRVDRVLDRKPIAAPKHHDIVVSQQASSPNLHVRDAELLTRLDHISLKQMSSDRNMPKAVGTVADVQVSIGIGGATDAGGGIGKRDKLPQRPEAQARREVARSEDDIESYGLFAREDAPAGKITLKVLMAMLNDVQSIRNRERWVSFDEDKRKLVGDELAKTYKLQSTDIATLAEFLGLFLVHVPESQKQRVHVEAAKLRDSPVSKHLSTDASLKQATQNLPPKTRLSSTESSGNPPASASG